MRKCCDADPVFSKELRVLGHTEFFEPVRKVLHLRRTLSNGC
jgi:hypothetical protein